MEDPSSPSVPGRSAEESPQGLDGAEQLRYFLTASSAMVYRMSADWKQMFTLEGKNISAGTDPATGNWMDRYIPQVDRELVWQAVERAIADRSIFELEHRVIQADGGVGWVLSRAVPVIGEDGEITGWVGAGTDISARKLAEQALRSSELLHRESSAKYLSLFNSIDQGFCVIKVLFDGFDRPYDYIFLEVNPVFEAQSGISGAVGRRMGELVPGLEQYWYDAYGQVARGGGSMRFEAEASVLGRWFDVYAFSAGMMEAGQVAMLFSDITPRKAQEQQLRQYSEELEKLVAERTSELQQNYSLLQTVYDTNLIGMSVFSPVYADTGEISDFRIEIVNKKIARTAGRYDLVGKLYSEVFPGIKKMGLLELMVSTYLSSEPGRMEYHYTFEGIDRWYSTQFVRGGELLVSTNLDISERVRAEQDRFRNYLLLQQSEELAKSGSWDIDLATGVFSWSEGMYKLYALGPGSPISPEIYLKYASGENVGVARRIVSLMRSGASGFEETIELDIAGQLKVIHLKAAVVSSEAGEPLRVLGVDLDVTEIRQAESRLLQLGVSQQQEIFRVTLAAQEEERRRISESLHNGLGQLLYGTRLSMNYMSLKMAASNPAKFTESRNYTAELLSEAIRETRRISHELMPTVLAEFGLKAAVKDVCDQLQDGVKFDCRVSVSRVKLDNYIELAVFRSVQELMVNVVRHADASRCRVRVEADRSAITVVVEDNGKGMDDALVRTGIGLSSIRTKVELLKGSMEISSSSGGTRVAVSFPLQLDGGIGGV